MFGFRNKNNSNKEKERRLDQLLAIDGVQQGLMTGMTTPMVMEEVQEAKKLLQELGRI